MSNQEYVLNLVDWESINDYSTLELIKECFNCRKANILDDGNVIIADPQSAHMLSNEELDSFVQWHLSLNK